MWQLTKQSVPWLWKSSGAASEARVVRVQPTKLARAKLNRWALIAGEASRCGLEKRKVHPLKSRASVIG
jgi:hypothetical protein